jgi:hypothetical protein
MNRYLRLPAITSCFLLLIGCSTAELEEQIEQQNEKLMSLEALCKNLSREITDTSTQLTADMETKASLESVGAVSGDLITVQQDVQKLWDSDSEVRQEFSDLRSVELARLTGDISTVVRDIKAAEGRITLTINDLQVTAGLAQSNSQSLGEMQSLVQQTQGDVDQVVFTLIEQLEQMKDLLQKSVESIAGQIIMLNNSTLKDPEPEAPAG